MRPNPGISSVPLARTTLVRARTPVKTTPCGATTHCRHFLGGADTPVVDVVRGDMGSGHEPDDMPEHQAVGWQHPGWRVGREAVWAVFELVEIAPVADVPMAGPFDLSGRLGGRRAGRPIKRADSARPGGAAARRSCPRCCSSCCPSGGPSASVCSGAAGRGIRIRLDLVDAIAETAGVPQGPLLDDAEELRAGHLQPRHAREQKQTRSRQALHEPSSMTFVIATTFVIAEPNLYATTTADRELQGHDVYKSDRSCQPK